MWKGNKSKIIARLTVNKKTVVWRYSFYAPNRIKPPFFLYFVKIVVYYYLIEVSDFHLVLAFKGGSYVFTLITS